MGKCEHCDHQLPVPCSCGPESARRELRRLDDAAPEEWDRAREALRPVTKLGPEIAAVTQEDRERAREARRSAVEKLAELGPCRPCPSCDRGLPMTCTCPEDSDVRTVSQEFFCKADADHPRYHDPGDPREDKDDASTLPDSGDRSRFSSGAVRDLAKGKGYFSLIPPIALRAIAKRYEDGARKYGRDNWQKGIPLSSYFDSLTRHTLAAAEGRTDEDHFGAILWNASAWLWTENEIREGRLPEELDDLNYRQRVSTVCGQPSRNVMFPAREKKS